MSPAGEFGLVRREGQNHHCGPACGAAVGAFKHLSGGGKPVDPQLLGTMVWWCGGVVVWSVWSVCGVVYGDIWVCGVWLLGWCVRWCLWCVVMWLLWLIVTRASLLGAHPSDYQMQYIITALSGATLHSD